MLLTHKRGMMREHEAVFLASAARPEQFPRTPWPEIAFAGRSNVGKSSVINRLFSRRDLARVSSTPGRTRTINFYQVDERAVFVDLPGYGYAKVSRAVQEAWWRLVETYLTQRVQLRGVIHIVDARHPPTPQDRELHAFLKAVGVPARLVLTKADRVPRGRRAEAWKVATAQVAIPVAGAPLFFSAETGEGAPELWRTIQECLRTPAGGARTEGSTEKGRDPVSR